MNHPFSTPEFYQGQANSLPTDVARAGQVFGGGQHQDVIGPWATEAQDIQSHYGTYPLSSDAAGRRGRQAGYFTPSAHDPVGGMIRSDMASAQMLDGEMAASQQLALRGIRRSGSMSRQVSVRGLGYNTPVRPGALRTYDNAQPLGNMHLYQQDVQQLGDLGASIDEQCGAWAPGSSTWNDPRNPLGAISAYILLHGWADTPPPSMGVAALDCVIQEIKTRLIAAGGRAGLDSFSKGYPDLEAARVRAGGVAQMGWADIIAAWGAKLYNWSPSDVEGLVEAAKKVNWEDADWLQQWADVTKGPAGGLAPVVSSSAGGAKQPWYSNPWVLGAGAAAIVGGVWFLTK